jgi:undecaprenyl diphosphate synthase
MTKSQLPSHLAVIMDGNGRWAELHGRPRTFGHLKGARMAKRLIENCADLGLEQLTLYAFSTENWLRPKAEVSFLMMLLGRHLRRERATLVKNGIRFSVIGDRDRLPKFVNDEVNQTIAETQHCTGMSLTFALSYGGRQEITNAVRSIADDLIAGRISKNDISEEMISSRLQTAEMKDPDLIIRTSGEFRLSNFLLWQAAYTELYVTPTLWPDFNSAQLNNAFRQYALRERRFGKTAAQVTVPAHSTAQSICRLSVSDIVNMTTATPFGLR